MKSGSNSRQESEKTSTRKAQVGRGRKVHIGAPNDRPFTFKSTKTMRAVRPPNIADLARRGGLTDPGAVPYRLSEYAGQWYLSASAVGTPTVSQYVILGFAQEVGDARYFCLQVDPNATPDLVAEKFPNLAFAGPEWVKKNIIEKHIADDHLEVGHELFDVLASKVRRLQAWPPPGHDNRTFRIAQGEIACRVLAELKHFNKACRREQLPLTGCGSSLALALHGNFNSN